MGRHPFEQPGPEATDSLDFALKEDAEQRRKAVNQFRLALNRTAHTREDFVEVAEDFTEEARCPTS